MTNSRSSSGVVFFYSINLGTGHHIPMLGDSLRTRVWLLILVTATLGAVISSAGSIPPMAADDWYVAAALVVLLFAVEHYDVQIAVSNGPFTMSVGATIAMAAAFHFDVSVAVMIVLSAHVLDSAIAQRQVLKSATNIGTYVCATFLAATVYDAIADTTASPLANVHNILCAVIASLAFVVISTSTFALIVGPILGIPFFEMWKQNIQTTALETIGLPALGGMIAVLANENATAVLLVGFPLMAPQLAYKALNDARESVRDTVESLVDTLEQRDASTADHSRRVAEYTAAIVDEMAEVPHQMTPTILWAARVHDLGKIGVRDATLFKPGRLTAVEQLEMQSHPVLGADIVARLAQSDSVAVIIRHHHERWDGKGYPDGLAGEAIPLGSRIIAVADTYEAMTADRPYRKALPTAVAFDEIVRNAGRQFDPAVVRAFERAFRPAALREQPAPHAGRLSTVA